MTGPPPQSSLRPSFLGIGAQKAGTTWLYRNFQRHPDIWMPPEKELHVFDEKLGNQHTLRDKMLGNRARDERWRRQVRRQLVRYRSSRSLEGIGWHARYFLGRPTERWYANLFAAGRGKVTGEITPDYSILSPEQVAAVRRVNPQMRIVFLMRNPVERAWSHAAMEIGRAKGHDLDEASAHLIRHFESPRPRRFGDYITTIETWSEAFDASQLFVGFLEDVARHPEALLSRICEHVGARPLERYPGAEDRVHSGALSSIPVPMAMHLAKLYIDQVEELSRRYGGYASWWLYCLQQLIDDPPDDPAIGYPFLSGPLWERWVSAAGSPAWLQSPQSGPLPSVSLSDRASAAPTAPPAPPRQPAP